MCRLVQKNTLVGLQLRRPPVFATWSWARSCHQPYCHSKEQTAEVTQPIFSRSLQCVLGLPLGGQQSNIHTCTLCTQLFNEMSLFQACSDKLQREIKEYGYPPVFPDDTDGVTEAKQEKTTDVEPANKRPKKVCTNLTVPLMYKTDVIQVKSKVAAKGGNMKYQWNIMKLLGFEDEEIKE